MKLIPSVGAAVALLSAISSAANAGVIVNIDQVGANVVATISGTLNLSGLTTSSGFVVNPVGVGGFDAYIGNGTPNNSVEGYYGFSGPGYFGPSGPYFDATTASGADFALTGSGFGTPYVFVDPGYSGGSLAGTETFDGTTLSGINLTPGTYTYTLPDDTIVVNIGNAVAGVPEPATLALFGLGLVGLGLSRRRLAR